MDSCAVCGLKIVDEGSGLCAIHSESYRNVLDAYGIWADAYGYITKEEFLKRLAMRPETGLRAKETAEFLTKNPDWWK